MWLNFLSKQPCITTAKKANLSLDYNRINLHSFFRKFSTPSQGSRFKDGHKSSRSQETSYGRWSFLIGTGFATFLPSLCKVIHNDTLSMESHSDYDQLFGRNIECNTLQEIEKFLNTHPSGQEVFTFLDHLYSSENYDLIYDILNNMDQNYLQQYKQQIVFVTNKNILTLADSYSGAKLLIHIAQLDPHAVCSAMIENFSELLATKRGFYTLLTLSETYPEQFPNDTTTRLYLPVKNLCKRSPEH